jgi:hypothetical protein
MRLPQFQAVIERRGGLLAIVESAEDESAQRVGRRFK